MCATQSIVLLTLLALFSCCDSVTIYSSFWAPLFDRHILNYRVDATFHPEHGKIGREQYAKDYGYRGERLIVDLGNGQGPANVHRDVQMYGDVKFSYT